MISTSLRSFSGMCGVISALICMSLTGPAIAHPHVWVQVRSQYVFAPNGMIAAVRHAWTFDAVYSAFAIQGLGKDDVPVDKGLQMLAQINVKQLSEYGYFTRLRIGGKTMAVGTAKDASITLDAKKIMTLHFTVPLKTPVMARPVAVLKVVDPSYFVAFDFARTDPVKLSGAPKGCSVSTMRPQPLSTAQQKRLELVQGTNESPGAGFGILLATSAIAACP